MQYYWTYILMYIILTVINVFQIEENFKKSRILDSRKVIKFLKSQKFFDKI